MTQPLDVTINTFLKIRLQPVAEELAANGAENLIIGYIPTKGIIHTVGTATAGTPEYAAQMKALGRQLIAHADGVAPANKPEERGLSPQHTVLT